MPTATTMLKQTCVNDQQIAVPYRQRPTYKYTQSTMKNPVGSILVLLCSFLCLTSCYEIRRSFPILLQERANDNFVCPTGQEGFFFTEVCTSIYYYCTSGGEAYPLECPPGTVFDPYQVGGAACVDLENAVCLDPDATTTAMTTEVPFLCPATDGPYPIYGTCSNEYFVCLGGLPSLKTCPDGAVFDPVTLVCTPSAEASCNQPFDCPADGYYPYPDGCASFYYVCLSGQSSIEFCPKNSIYDPATNKCETSENASCTPGPYTTTSSSTTEKTTTPTTTSVTSTSMTSTSMTSTTTRIPNNCEGPTTPYVFVCPGNGQYPYGECSSQYWQCSNGYAYLVCCPSNLVFNPALNNCDYYYNVPGCNAVKSDAANPDQQKTQAKLSVETSDSLIETDTDFECPSYGIHPHPLYCDWYYTCYYEEPAYLWECRGDFLFQSSDRKCDYPELTDCGDRIRPNSTVETPAKTFKCQTDGFFSIGFEECSSTYVTCVDGIAYYKECPADGVFDRNTQICTEAHLVSC